MTVEPYRPSSGDEGAWFMSQFCHRCRRDVDQGCPIAASALALDEGHHDYPAEWVEGTEGPRCTAYDAAGVSVRELGDG